MKNIGTVIIAAGYSSRMNAFKPLLKFGGLTAVETITRSHMAAGVKEIIIVVGYQGDQVEAVMKDMPVTIVYNENYDEGMYSSVQKGVRALSHDTDGFLLQPVDIPLIKPYTIKTLLEYAETSQGGILYPTYDGRRAHPPLISSRYIEPILKDPGEDGLRGVLRKFGEDAEHIPVHDRTVIMDMDNQEAYAELVNYDHHHTPGPLECQAILKWMVDDAVKEAIGRPKAPKDDLSVHKADSEAKDLTLAHMEQVHIEKVLRLNHGNISKTAKDLGIRRNTLYSKIEKYGIG